MIKSDFQGIKGAHAVRAADDQTASEVEALNDGAAVLLFGPEVIAQQIPVRAKHAGDLFHRLDPAAHGTGRPDLKKGQGPGDTVISPEVLESLLEQPSPGSAQGLAQQGV